MSDSLLHPKHPERICWGCDRYCRANDLACREDRVPHPIEPFGYDPGPMSLQQICRSVTVECPLQSIDSEFHSR